MLMFASGFLDLVHGSLVNSWLLWDPLTITDGHVVSVQLVMPSGDKITLDQY